MIRIRSFSLGVLIAGILLAICSPTWAQEPSSSNLGLPDLPMITTPKPVTLTPPSLIPGFPTGTPVGRHPSIPSPSRPNFGYTESVQRQMHMQQFLTEIQLEALRSSYDFPEINKNIPGVEYYDKAFKSLENMIQGKKPMRLADAVFQVENAFYGGKLSRQAFDKALNHYAEVAVRWVNGQGLDASSSMVRIYGLQKLFTDTLEVSSAGLESMQIHYPFDYDFEDSWGREDYTKQFVTKLLATGSGQCYSLPMLFLLLAEQLNVDAYLTFSPQHSFIRFKDEHGNWYNFETTSGYLVSDAWVMGSGYVTAEAIRSKIYLEPLGIRQVIAHKLADLGQSYRRKYGNRPFVKKAVQTSLSYLPNNIFALKVQAGYQTDLVNWLWNIRDNPDPEKFESDPKIRAIVAERDNIYKYIDDTGFQPIPEKVYNTWLESVEREKGKQEQQKQYLRITEQPQN